MTTMRKASGSLRRNVFSVAALSISIALLGCAAERDDGETLVFAAASLSDVLQEIDGAWRAGGGEAPRFNFAGSNELSRQILAGAPADLFLSADRAQVDRVVEAGLAQADEITELLANELVVIGAEPGPAPFSSARDLLAVERLALADPSGVPAGVYAKKWLENLGLWSELEARVVPALDVRAALQAVASGDVEAGIVYATDANAPGASGRVRVLLRVDSADPAAPPVRYYLCPLRERGGASSELAQFLRGEEASAIFARAGFQPLGAER
jgi:molybdate transport system substrate-binding protein